MSSQSSTGFQFSFNSSLSISLSSADLVIPHLTPGNYASSNTITVNVSTNNSYGYTLIAKVGDKDNPVLSNNNLVNTTANTTTGNSDAFTSLSTSDKLTIANFNDNKWGYTVASNIDSTTTIYSGLLYNADTVINATKTSTGIPMSNTYPGTNNTSFTIAAKAGGTLSSGEYTNIINFRSVANVNTDISITDLTYMQDIAKLTNVERQAVISSMVTGTTYQLQDSRDDATYNIAKLKDGNIWMQDNLALNLTNSTILNNTTSANTNASNTTLNYLKNGGGTVSDQYATSGIGNLTSGNSYSVPLVNADYKEQTEPFAVNQSGNNKIGTYYNYCAASAGSYCYGDGMNEGVPSSSVATEDICPKGWRLPTGGTYGEFQTLREKYVSDGEYVLALRLPLAGAFYDGSANLLGSEGYYWSSTYLSTTFMHALPVLTSGVYPKNHGYRYDGFLMRCIFSPSTHDTIDPANLNMQNATVDDLAALMMNIGDTAMLTDIRNGTSYKIGKLADGKYWMLDNLALDPATLKSGVALDSTNTNLPAGTTFNLPNSTSVGFDANAYSFTTAAINTDSKNIDMVLGAGQSGTGKVGVYYNYCAASAGTYCVGPGSGSSDGVYDICPKGWRLPTGGASGEFQTLRDKYSSDGEYVLALRTPLSGYFVDGSIGVQGDYGLFWSSTRYDAIDMRRLIVTSTDVDTLYGTGGRGYGFSVRCVKK